MVVYHSYSLHHLLPLIIFTNSMRCTDRFIMIITLTKMGCLENNDNINLFQDWCELHFNSSQAAIQFSLSNINNAPCNLHIQGTEPCIGIFVVIYKHTFSVLHTHTIYTFFTRDCRKYLATNMLIFCQRMR